MQDYVALIIFVSIVLCIFIISIIIYYGKGNILLILGAVFTLSLFGAIIACLFIINDLLKQLNGTTQTLQTQTKSLGDNVTNLSTNVTQFGLDLSDASKVLTDYIAANSPPAQNFIQEQVSEEQVKELIFEGEPLKYQDAEFTNAMKGFVEVLDKNTKEIQQNIETTTQEVVHANIRIDNLPEAVTSSVVSNLTTNPEKLTTLTNAIVNNPEAAATLGNSAATVIVTNEQSINTISEAISTNPVVQQTIIQNITGDFTQVKEDLQVVKNEMTQISNDNTQVKVDIVQLTANVSQAVADATQNKTNVYSMDDYLGYLYLTLGVKDDQGVPFDYSSIQPVNP